MRMITPACVGRQRVEQDGTGARRHGSEEKKVSGRSPAPTLRMSWLRASKVQLQRPQSATVLLVLPPVTEPGSTLAHSLRQCGTRPAVSAGAERKGRRRCPAACHSSSSHAPVVHRRDDSDICTLLLHQRQLAVQAGGARLPAAAVAVVCTWAHGQPKARAQGDSGAGEARKPPRHSFFNLQSSYHVPSVEAGAAAEAAATARKKKKSGGKRAGRTHRRRCS